MDLEQTYTWSIHLSFPKKRAAKFFVDVNFSGKRCVIHMLDGVRVNLQNILVICPAHVDSDENHTSLIHPLTGWVIFSEILNHRNHNLKTEAIKLYKTSQSAVFLV